MVLTGGTDNMSLSPCTPPPQTNLSHRVVGADSSIVITHRHVVRRVSFRNQVRRRLETRGLARAVAHRPCPEPDVPFASAQFAVTRAYSATLLQAHGHVSELEFSCAAGQQALPPRLSTQADAARYSTAENLANQYGITRQQCDEYAVQSQQRWKAGASNQSPLRGRLMT